MLYFSSQEWDRGVWCSDHMYYLYYFFYNRMANVLFYPKSIYSYVFVQFTSEFDMICGVLDAPIHVSTPVGELVIVAHVYRTCPILRMSLQT